MKERQRWQPEEDALLRNYVEQFGAKDWGKVLERTGKALDRDAKSCMERWKNYLKPGIKKTPLTQEEKLLIISLQEKYGNKWKKIAAEVPGRTAKRLGKWWEVHKEKEKKDRERQWGASLGDESANYNELFMHIAEKLDHRQVGSSSSSVPATPSFTLQHRLFTPASCVLGSSTMEPDLFSPQALYLRQQTPLSVGSTSSSSSVNTTSLPVATPFNLETDETKAIGAISSSRPEARSGEIQDGPSFPLVSPIMQLGSRETSSLPPWMSTLPSTSGSVKMFPNFEGLHQTHKVGSSHLRSDNHGDRARHLSVGLSLASSPSPGDGADESSPNWSLDVSGIGGLTNNTRSSGAQEEGGQRASWCPAQPTVGRIPSGLMDEVRMRNFYPKSLEDLIEYWKELDEKSRLWSAQRKEDSWRLQRMKRQMVEEKLAKGRKKAEEVDIQTAALRVEQRKYLEHLEYEYREKVEMMEREAEAEDSKRFDEWIRRQQQIIQEQTRFLEEWNRRSKADG